MKIKEEKKILFITHEATRTGAPILLLNFMKWLQKNHPHFQQHIIINKKGALSKEFKKVAITYETDKSFNTKFNFINRKLNLQYVKKLYEKINNLKVDFIFSNTIVNGITLEKLDTKDIPVISYIHELEYSIRKFEKMGKIQGTLSKTNFFLCGSDMVRKNIIQNHNIKDEKTAVVYSFSELQSIEKKVEKNLELRKKLNIPVDATVVTMMGSYIWRKGSDVFFSTATQNKNKNIYFLWIGVDDDSSLAYDMENLENKPNIQYFPSSENYADFFHITDLFYLSSREDPYPMVAVEASAYGIPILCFKNATGIVEFMDEKTGHIANYLDVIEVNDFINNFAKINTNSTYIKDKSLKFNDINTNAQKIIDIIYAQKW